MPAAGIPGLSAAGFALHCAHDTSRVVAGSEGYGLNPVEQSLEGPSVEFIQPVDPLDYLGALGVQPPQLCVSPGDSGAPSPPPSLGPLLLPGMPSSTCQVLSTNTFAGNGFSATFGHLEQRLAAQPPLPAELGTGPVPDTGMVANPVGAFSLAGTAGTPGRPGTRGRPGTHRDGTQHGAAALVAAIEDRRRLLFAYGAWEAAVLGTLLLGAAIVRRRRREGVT